MPSFRALDIAVVLVAVFLVAKLRGRRKGRSPPGPRGLPIIGNVLDVPLVEPWKTFSDWGRRWGGLVQISMMGQPIVVVNSWKAASDLLDKRSNIYSDRAQPPSADYIGYTKVLPLVPYGDRLKEHRRMIAKVVGSRVQVEKFGDLQEHVTHKFLNRLLTEPEHFPEHIEKLTGASILSITHGYQIREEGRDPMIDIIVKSSDSFAKASMPGTFLIDVIPALRYWPSWLPGGGWRKLANECKANLDRLREAPHAFTKKQIEQGTAPASVVSKILEEKQTPEFEQEVKQVNVALVAGATDTTIGTLTSFFLAMQLYPEVQRKAQAEIDAVIGHDRLPTFQDRDRLPYVNRLCLELLRWMPVGPLGVPHVLTVDDEYDGYFFEKGTQFLTNLWGMLHDPETYSSPDDFMPERYETTKDHAGEIDPHAIVFGFGRRSCPGLHVVDATVFIAATSILATFNVEKVVKNGVTITPPFAQSSGVISHPLPFEASIKPRSANAAALIRSAIEHGDKPDVHV